MRARQSVHQDVVGARDELWSQMDVERLRPAQDLLSYGVERRRPGSSLFAEIRHCRDVVSKLQPYDRAETTESGGDRVGWPAAPWRL